MSGSNITLNYSNIRTCHCVTYSSVIKKKLFLRFEGDAAGQLQLQVSVGAQRWGRGLNMTILGTDESSGV